MDHNEFEWQLIVLEVCVYLATLAVLAAVFVPGGAV